MVFGYDFDYEILVYQEGNVNLRSEINMVRKFMWVWRSIENHFDQTRKKAEG